MRMTKFTKFFTLSAVGSAKPGNAYVLVDPTDVFLYKDFSVFILAEHAENFSTLRPLRKWHLDIRQDKGLNKRGRFSSEKRN
ncbi:MAG: hypothetical protein V7K21_18180 [Nostoc sp.]